MPASEKTGTPKNSDPGRSVVRGALVYGRGGYHGGEGS